MIKICGLLALLSSISLRWHWTPLHVLSAASSSTLSALLLQRHAAMLASPLLPIQPSFTTADDSLQYRPSKDKEAFNSLLPPPIEFVEGSSSGALAVPPGKYEPINASPKAVKPNVSVFSRYLLSSLKPFP